MSKWLLTPRIHILLSIAYGRTGDEKGEAMERSIAFTCIEGIESTGDGSQASPYVVTSTADEYDVLMFREKKLKLQALTEKDGRFFDVMTCEDGAALWFDITTPYLWMQTRMQKRNPRRP